MIKVTRLNGTETLVNPEIIETVESNPDTMITLTNGKKVFVKESLEAILKKFLTYQQLINRPLASRVIKPAEEFPGNA